MSDDTPMSGELKKLMNDLEVLRDEIRLQLHLASAEAATTWREDLEPRMQAARSSAERAGHAASEATTRLAGDLKEAFQAFRDRLG